MSIEQPAVGDGEKAWRQYAGDLRQALGTANREVQRREELLRRAQQRNKSLQWVLNRVREHLGTGDIESALDKIALREGWIAERTGSVDAKP